MKNTRLMTLLVAVAPLLVMNDHAQAQGSSSSLTCPPNYALSIDPPPQPTSDPSSSTPQKPLSATEKEQAQELAKANEMSRWHCVPLNSLQSEQPQ